MLSHRENLDRVKEHLSDAAFEREKGDTLRDMEEADEAEEAWRAALGKLTEAQELLDNGDWNRLEDHAAGEELPTDQRELVEQLVETLGQKGGIHRRLGEYGHALESYRRGADEEKVHLPSSTYNRVNRVKLSLLEDNDTGLEDLEGEIRELAEDLQQHLSENQELSDSGWAWADLGDCRAFLGELDEAETAYRSFIGKAESQAPDSTLEVLNSVAKRLVEKKDPKAGRIVEAAASLGQRLQ